MVCISKTPEPTTPPACLTPREGEQLWEAKSPEGREWGHLMVDIQTGVITGANPLFRRWLGSKLKQLAILGYTLTLKAETPPEEI